MGRVSLDLTKVILIFCFAADLCLFNTDSLPRGFPESFSIGSHWRNLQGRLISSGTLPLSDRDCGFLVFAPAGLPPKLEEEPHMVLIGRTDLCHFCLTVVGRPW
jgi:hypothetical protein